ncbi:protein of unknown function [Legionella fallonii LLAP-10]|uniref:Uncharacterized protein n=1 Tax=Legionella fallonii LLAP-10 TaxID=1212491 RepID=A0A098G8Y7_9GAMM|nr:protein of unknown function [Legionella fallonii LLAP-10]
MKQGHYCSNWAANIALLFLLRQVSLIHPENKTKDARKERLTYVL